MTTSSDKETNSSSETALSREMFIVCIGASAGGLEAIRELVKNLPLEIPASYVVAQHMSPDHKSLMTTLIVRETELKVVDVEDGIIPLPNTIYITPPNNDVVIRDGKLTLLAPSNHPASPKPSVDRLFISAAETFGEKSVGIVLSGTGSDGSYGVQAIRAAGGITIAQDQKSAKYDGMPMASLETGCTDLVLSPIKIGTHLAKILASPRQLDEIRVKEVSHHPLGDLLQIVLAKTRVDFRDYKPTTIQRRLERRMNALGLAGVQEYTNHCRSNPREIDALFKDLLISVTRFFRDKDQFFAIKSSIESIVNSSKDGTIRVWIAGCATGEEAYSVAILFAEAMGGLSAVNKGRLQIFATDIDKNALHIARKGQYSRAALDDIPEDYTEKYFEVFPDYIAVKSRLKDVILFSDHNLCQDPPFLNASMICCRNLLIYFSNALQIKVLSRMHYSLEDDGLLFLGTAESVSLSEDLFKRVSNETHLYRKRFLSTQSRATALMKGNRTAVPDWIVPVRTPTPKQPDPASIDRIMFEQLVKSVGPNAVLLTDDFRIIRVFGDLSRFVSINSRSQLQFSLSMLLPPLAREARTLTTIALKRRQMRKGVTHRLDGDHGHAVVMHAYPFAGPDLDEGFVLLTIRRSADETSANRPSIVVEDAEAARHLEALEIELETARTELQQTIEELETSNEELQSTNEELQSTNEELQATNEELETSNEELQSTNEELVTVNEELHVASAQLTNVNDEQETMFAQITAPILILDVALQITKASDSAIELFNLRKPLENPHLSHCRLPEDFPFLTEFVAETLKLGIKHRTEFTAGRTFYTCESSPIFSSDGHLRGATLILSESREASRLSEELRLAFADTGLFTMSRRLDGTILSISESAQESYYGPNVGDLVGRNIKELIDPNTLEDVTTRDKQFIKSGLPHAVDTYPIKTLHMGNEIMQQVHRYRSVDLNTGDPAVFAVSIDISNIQEKERQLDKANKLMSVVFENLPVIFMCRDSAGKILNFSNAGADLVNMPRDKVIGQHLSVLLGNDAAAEVLADDKQLFESGEIRSERILTLPTPNGPAKFRNTRLLRGLDDTDNLPFLLSFVEELATADPHDKQILTDDIEQIMSATNRHLWAFNADGSHLFVSAGFRQLVEDPAASAIVELDEIIACFHSKERKSVRAALKRAREGTEEIQFAGRIKTSKGATVPVSVECYCRKTSDNERRVICVVAEDKTVSRQSKSAKTEADA